MNFIKKALLAAICVGAFGSAAQATPISVSATNDTNAYISAGDWRNAATSTSFTLSLPGGTSGYVAGVDTIGSATFSLYLQDDSFIDGDESYKLVLGSSAQTVTGSNISYCFNSCNDLVTSFTLDTQALADLAYDGKISVTVTSTEGDFYFDKATLAANVTKGPAGGGSSTSVPEPGSVALLGLGLMGFVASRRKAAKNKNA